MGGSQLSKFCHLHLAYTPNIGNFVIQNVSLQGIDGGHVEFWYLRIDVYGHVSRCFKMRRKRTPHNHPFRINHRWLLLCAPESLNDLKSGGVEQIQCTHHFIPTSSMLRRIHRFVFETLKPQVWVETETMKPSCQTTVFPP